MVEGLKINSLNIDINDVNNSLNRLEIAYIIGKYKGEYSYRIPLFREKLLEDDIEINLEGDIIEYRKILAL